MVGVLALALLFGITTAWIVTNYDFPLKKYVDLILILPAACPAYLVAYAYTDFFEYAGPIQGILRNVMGWSNASEYYFPEIRSVGGAIFVLASVLYPYIYLLVRTAFSLTPTSLLEVSSIYGRSKFWNVSLPIARPAIAASSALVCMEVVSDFGTVEYFSLETLTLGIFNVWIGMNNITAASQIAIFTFLFIILLLLVETRSRSEKRFHDTSRHQSRLYTKEISMAKGLGLILLCSIPVLCGFFIPISILISNINQFFNFKDLTTIIPILLNTMLVASLGSIIIVSVATFLACTTAAKGNKKLQSFVNISTMGYAFPGTMLAIGVLIMSGVVDRSLNNNYFFSYLSTRPIFVSGTLSVLLFAYLVRFLAVSYGANLSGLSKISANLNWASRTLSTSFSNTITHVSIPLIKKSIIAGGLLAFVDITKELPMTLLLRPFNFETLATHTYQFAHDELMAKAALPALIIILFGLMPVIFLNNILKK
jgi:iron(III) transport system permease protein